MIYFRMDGEFATRLRIIICNHEIRTVIGDLQQAAGEYLLHTSLYLTTGICSYMAV